MPANPKVDVPSTKPQTLAQRWLAFDPFSDEKNPKMKSVKRSLNILRHMNVVAEEQRFRFMEGRRHPAHFTLDWSDRDIAEYLRELAEAYAEAQSERVK